MKDDWLWLLIIGGIIVAGALGGFKSPTGKVGFTTGSFKTGSFPTSSGTLNGDQSNIQQQITSAQYKVEELRKQVQIEIDKKTASPYKGIVTIRSVQKSANPANEYIILRVSGAKNSINITGWTLTSTSTGASVKIPKSTRLFFTGMVNPEEDVYVENGDTVFINTGVSPNGSGFKVNKCSGYLSQFQTWTPSLSTNCPLPKNENLSSIPRTVVNDACFDYINIFPQCRIQTQTLPLKWSYECTNFIYNKINYASCIDSHKNDTDFYQHEWRIFLKRSDRLWKTSRENITLYDNLGKTVATIYY